MLPTIQQFHAREQQKRSHVSTQGQGHKCPNLGNHPKAHQQKMRWLKCVRGTQWTTTQWERIYLCNNLQLSKKARPTWVHTAWFYLRGVQDQAACICGVTSQDYWKVVVRGSIRGFSGQGRQGLGNVLFLNLVIGMSGVWKSTESYNYKWCIFLNHIEV